MDTLSEGFGGVLWCMRIRFVMVWWRLCVRVVRCGRRWSGIRVCAGRRCIGG